MSSQEETSGALMTANQYLHGELPASQAARELGQAGIIGTWLAGEVMLDHATKVGASEAQKDISDAGEFFIAVREAHSRLASPDAQFEQSEALFSSNLRLGQLSVYKIVYGNLTFPSLPETKAMYSEILDQAGIIQQAARLYGKDRRPPAVSTRTLRNKVAVLLTATRPATRSVEAIERLPLQSVFSEYTGDDRLTSSGGFGWDLNIFSPDNDGAPRPARQLRIRSYISTRPVIGPTIHTDPDLALFPGETSIQDRAILDCIREQRQHRDMAARDRLNQRALQLFAVIETQTAKFADHTRAEG